MSVHTCAVCMNLYDTKMNKSALSAPPENTVPWLKWRIQGKRTNLSAKICDICQLESAYENHPGGYFTTQLSPSKSHVNPSGQHEFIPAAVLYANQNRR